MNRSTIAVLAATVICSGCGSFPLGTAFPERNQSKDETRLAVLECQDRAKNEANSDARVAGAFIAGLTYRRLAAKASCAGIGSPAKTPDRRA